jgi:hypothetical protein
MADGSDRLTLWHFIKETNFIYGLRYRATIVLVRHPPSMWLSKLIKFGIGLQTAYIAPCKIWILKSL